MTAKSLQPRVHVDPVLSYACGVARSGLTYETFGQLFESTVKEAGDRNAIISVEENVELTYNEMNQLVDRLAIFLYRHLKIVAGDVIAVMSGNCSKLLVIQFACAKIGAIFAPINAHYKADDLEYVIKLVTPKVLIIPGPNSPQEQTVNKFYDLFWEIRHSLPASLRSLILLDCQPPLTEVNKVKVYLYDKIVSSKTEEYLPKDLSNEFDADSICCVYFTSGTTGRPKGVKLSHFNIINVNRNFGLRHDLNVKKATKLCSILPYYFVYGSTTGGFLMANFGVTLVIPSFRFNSASMAEAILQHKCSYIYCVPTMLLDMIKYLEVNNKTAPSLRFLLVGGAIVPKSLLVKINNVAPEIDVVHIGYGLTETSCLISASVPEDDLGKTLDNVGLPMDYCQVKIVNPKTGVITKLGQEGELLVRGPQVYSGYWNDPEQTEKTFEPGNWFRTGDLATMDPGGYLRIVGRIKEIIIRGGLNISAKEIEDVLMLHESVDLAAVCGAPDERLGEVVCAWIRLKSKVSKEELIRFCKDKMPSYKVPQYIHFTSEFPLTASGKIQKFRMKELSCEIFQLKN